MTGVEDCISFRAVLDNLPDASKLKRVLVGLAFFLLGAVVGAGSFYFYTIKVMIPKYKTQMMGEMFSERETDWGDFFKKVEEKKSEEEFVNPFEGAGETGEEEYVNPFELIE